MTDKIEERAIALTGNIWGTCKCDNSKDNPCNACKISNSIAYAIRTQVNEARRPLVAESQEFLDRCKHFYRKTDGTYDFPNSREGDLIRIRFNALTQDTSRWGGLGE